MSDERNEAEEVRDFIIIAVVAGVGLGLFGLLTWAAVSLWDWAT